ncbi:YihY/virulence factor BrkB family protein [Egibacter rhizosphaerae]|nr:YhjD/YihY/BrkB family envelope integrity protein [Egibacter rhizosphaerae]
MIRATLRAARDVDLVHLASAVAFRIVLAFFPALLAGVSVLVLVVDGASVVAVLERIEVVPAQIVEIAEQPIADAVDRARAGAGGAIALGTLIGLWAATGAAAALGRALTIIRGVDPWRRGLRRLGAALVLVVIGALALLALLVLLVVGEAVQELLLPGQLPAWATPLGTLVRVAVAGAVTAVAVAAAYRIAPDAPPVDRRLVTPGSLFAVGAILLLSAVVGRVVGGGLTLNPTLSGIGSIVAALIWLQACCVLLLLGALIDVLRARREGPPPEPGLVAARSTAEAASDRQHTADGGEGEHRKS